MHGTIGNMSKETNLRKARKAAGFKSARAAALRFGWVTEQGNTSTYASHENGQTPIPRADAEEYARKFKVKGGAAWLMDLKGFGNPPSSNISSVDESCDSSQLAIEREKVAVPEIDDAAAADYARFGQEQNIGPVRALWGIPPSFLNDDLRIRSGRAQLLQVRGDSMEDALSDGDRAIIDLDDTDIRQGGIFALLDDVAKLIIIQVTPVHGSRGRRILCTYANSRYPPFELPVEDPVKIIGRVAARITRL